MLILNTRAVYSQFYFQFTIFTGGLTLNIKNTTVAVPIGALIGLVLGATFIGGAWGMVLGTVVGGLIGGSIGLYFARKN